MCDQRVQDLALCRVTSPTPCPPRRRTVLPMLARVRSAAVLGIDAYLVDVETDIANGLPTFATVGLPQGAVKEGRERVYAALARSEEHTSELQSLAYLVCRLLLEKKKKITH